MTTGYDDRAEQIASEVWDMIKEDAVLKGSHQSQVLHFKQPSELQEEIPFKIEEQPCNNLDLLDLCKKVLHFSVRTGHPMFFNQQYCGGDPFGIVAAWLTEALNTNEHTYEVAPVFTCVTQEVISKLNSLIGFNHGDGIFCAGGSMANMMGMALARYKFSSLCHQQGLFGMNRLVFFASEDSHYSYAKGMFFLGFGAESLVKVKTDAAGRISITDLKEKIKQEKNKGHIPIAVLAISGTTVLGAYDDLNAVADICQEHQLYMHVDACWGGGVIFSETQRPVLAGIHRANSAVISLHKMAGAPIQCVVLLVQEQGILEKCFGYEAPYLFHPDKCYDTTYDLGKKTLMCSRKADSMKIWLLWKARGDSGMKTYIDRLFQLADYFKESIKKKEGFQLVMDQFQCTNICFWYIPARMRHQQQDAAWWQELHQVAPKIKQRMLVSGKMLIAYQPLPSHDWVNFFRIIIVNPRVTFEDLDQVIKNFDEFGQDL